MFSKIVAMLVMACALLMGAQSATAQDLVEVELVAAYGDTTSKLYESYGIPAKDRKSAVWWERTRVNGKPITDVNFIRAGDKLTLVVPKDGLANVATPETLTAGIEESKTGVLKGAKPNTQSATSADESVVESTKPQAEQPASKQTPEIFLGNPLESGLRPATQLPNFAPVNREAEERQAAKGADLENIVHTLVAAFLAVVALIVFFEMVSSLSGSRPKLSKTKPSVVGSREELEAMSQEFYAQSAQASKARKPKTGLTAPIKRFVANGGRIATDVGTKATSVFTRPGVKTQKVKKERWAGKSKPVEGPPMLLLGKKSQKTYTPPAQFAKANTAWNPDTPEAIEENGVLHQQLFGGEQKEKESSTQKPAHLTVVPKTSTLVVAPTPRNRLPVTVSADFAQDPEKRVLYLEIENVKGVPHFFWPGKGLVKYTRADVARMLRTWEGQEHYKVFLKPLELEKSKAKLNHDPELLIEGTLPGPESVRIRLEPAMASA